MMTPSRRYPHRHSGCIGDPHAIVQAIPGDLLLRARWRQEPLRTFQNRSHCGVITTACPGLSARTTSPSLTSAVPANVTVSTVTFVNWTAFTRVQATGSFQILRL